MNHRLSYPEIEARAVNHHRDLERIYSKHNPPATLVDLLEIGPAPKHEILWKEGLDHDSLLAHFENATPRDKAPAPVLRVFFLGTIRAGTPDAELLKHVGVMQCARLHPATADWMREKFAVSPIFLDSITFGHLILKTGNICFRKRDETGNVVVIDGFYRYSCGFFSGTAHIWFSHDLTRRSSVYVADNCPPGAKQLILSCAMGKHPEALWRPCAVDGFIAEDCAQSWGDELIPARSRLIRYEHMRTASQNLSPADTAIAVEDLHHLSQTLHIIYEDMTDLEERLQFLLDDVHKKYITYSSGLQQAESVAESLQFLASRTKIWKRWTMNYRARSEIRINLIYNLAAQNDNRTNLDIASFTSKIAIETQRDSSAMITIAAVTMFFLPGTFVSTVFSMVFFNTGTDSKGRTILTVAPQWWYVVAIAGPLTVIVFGVWIVWQRWRNNIKGVGRADVAWEKV